MQRLRAAALVGVVPAVKRRARDAELVQGGTHRQVGLLDQPDDLQLLGGRIPHASSPPAPLMLMGWPAPHRTVGGMLLPWRNGGIGNGKEFGRRAGYRSRQKQL